MQEIRIELMMVVRVEASVSVVLFALVHTITGVDTFTIHYLCMHSLKCTRHQLLHPWYKNRQATMNNQST